MLPRAQRLTSREFETAFGQGKVLRHPLLQLRVFRRSEEIESPKQSGAALQTRAAFVAPKKLGGAVMRNRVRRRVRERYRLHPAQREASWQRRMRGCDLIFVVMPAAIEASSSALDEALGQLLQRAARATRREKGLSVKAIECRDERDAA